MPRKIAILPILAVFCASSAAWSAQCSAIYDVPNEKGTPLPAERVIRVPDQRQERALFLLGAKTFVPVSRLQIKELLISDAQLNEKSLLEKQAVKADEGAATCRHFAADSYYADRKDTLLAAARSYEQFAAYIRSLQKGLYPYLVKTTVLFEHTGGYSVFLKNYHLDVNHGSLGRSHIEPQEVAVVILSDTEVHEVAVSYSAAE